MRLKSMPEVAQTLPPPNPAAILEIAQGYQRSFILKAGVDLDLFTEIAKGSQTVPAIAKACKGSERGVRILCDNLTVLGLLAKKGDRYSVTPDSALGPEDPIWVDFAGGMAPMMVPAAQALARLVQPLLAAKPAPKVLDIAAGHGIFGITVAQQLPSVQIYAVDWANVLEVARENAQAGGVSGRHHIIPGSAFDVDYGTGYDAALVTNFLHHFEPSTNESLLKKIAASMNRGAHLMVLEFVPNHDRVSPPMPALFSATMLSNTPHRDAYTFSELSRMCHNAGFAEIRPIQLAPVPQTLVVARKP